MMPRLLLLCGLTMLLSQAGSVGSAEVTPQADRVRVHPELLNQVKVELAEPVVVALSPANEMRWGHYQFPKLSRLPSGELLVTFNITADADLAYGDPSPAYVSSDDGQTWRRYEGSDQMLTVPSSPILALAGGEFLITPYPPGMNLQGMAGLPQPLGKYFSYFDRLLYEQKACPQEVQEYMSGIPAYRWTPQTRAWRAETLHYELRDALIETSESDKQTSSISRPSLEWLPAEKAGVLYYPDFCFHYKRRDGSLPHQLAVHCMVSKDGGRNWERRGEIATDVNSEDGVSESVIANTTRDDLVCILRSSDQKARPMYISFSSDGGWNWSPRQVLFDFGTMPHAMSMRDGLLVLTFGRPGINLSVSPDGSGREWTPFIKIFPRDPHGKPDQTCGYTSLVKLSETELLMAYSDFQHRSTAGTQHKAILVQKVTFPRKSK